VGEENVSDKEEEEDDEEAGNQEIECDCEFDEEADDARSDSSDFNIFDSHPCWRPSGFFAMLNFVPSNTRGFKTVSIRRYGYMMRMYSCLSFGNMDGRI
jgi:hypothetical protein